MAERGRCGGCGGVYSVTSKGVIRSHWSRFPAPSEAQFGRTHYGRCSGLGMPPIGPDEPLHRTEVSDLRRELTAVRGDVAQLQHALAAERANGRAWKLRAESLEHLYGVEEALWKLAEVYRRTSRSSDDERAARFEADMEKLRAQYPLLRETT